MGIGSTDRNQTVEHRAAPDSRGFERCWKSALRPGRASIELGLSWRGNDPGEFIEGDALFPV